MLGLVIVKGKGDSEKRRGKGQPPRFLLHSVFKQMLRNVTAVILKLGEHLG